MSEAVEEFDQFSDHYGSTLDQCVRLSGQDADYFAEVKARLLLTELARRSLDAAVATVVDLGCGTGSTAAHLHDRVGAFLGADVSGASLPVARAAAPAGSFVHTDDVTIPLKSRSVDAVLMSCVMHHIGVTDRAAVAREVARVLKPGGFVMVVEHNPFNPVTRWIVNRCEFDKDAVLLRSSETKKLLAASGFGEPTSRYILFVPGKSRLVARLNDALRKVPLGAQYSVTASPGV